MVNVLLPWCRQSKQENNEYDFNQTESLMLYLYRTFATRLFHVHEHTIIGVGLELLTQTRSQCSRAASIATASKARLVEHRPVRSPLCGFEGSALKSECLLGWQL